MTENEINNELREIGKELHLFDSIVDTDYETGEGKLNKRQVVAVKRLFELFETLRWQLAFNSYKELKHDDSKIFHDKDCGIPVRIRPCAEEYKGKTYFGILLGDAALSVGFSIKDGIVTSSFNFHNPAIFVPELKKIIYGCESWWGPIENEEELKLVITDETIQNVWYVKALKTMYPNKEEDK